MKKLLCVIPLAALLCFTFACQNKAEKAELEKFRAQARVEEQNKALVKKGGELLNNGDFEAFKAIIAPEYLLYLPPSRGAKPRSREEYIEGLKILGKAFPDLSWNVEELIAAGDKVVLRYVFRGTHRGEYEGIPGTGNQVEFSGIAIFRVENRKWVEERVEEDNQGFLQQLGMEFKPKEAEKK
jgi:steroid delta-isomerase-like uncharacterized protein